MDTETLKALIGIVELIQRGYVSGKPSRLGRPLCRMRVLMLMNPAF